MGGSGVAGLGGGGRPLAGANRTGGTTGGAGPGRPGFVGRGIGEQP